MSLPCSSSMAQQAIMLGYSIPVRIGMTADRTQWGAVVKTLHMIMPFPAGESPRRRQNRSQSVTWCLHKAMRHSKSISLDYAFCHNYVYTYWPR